MQSEIDEITRQLIDVKQQLLAAQIANGEVILLKEELATSQANQKAKRGRFIIRQMKKT